MPKRDQRGIQGEGPEAAESPRFTRQWSEVIAECQGNKADAVERLRIDLLNVDYVTSFELPFRLLLTRTPQLIACVRDELQLSQKNVQFNGKRFGSVYSLKMDLGEVPDDFRYRLTIRMRRTGPSGDTATLYRHIAQETNSPRERLERALENGLAVMAQDGLFWFGLQRIAAECTAIESGRHEDSDIGSGSLRYPDGNNPVCSGIFCRGGAS